MVDIGASASLQCFASGGPITSLYWMKDGIKLNMKSNKEPKDMAILNISKVETDTKGMYQCFAENDFQIEQASAQLILSGASSLIGHFLSECKTKGLLRHQPRKAFDSSVTIISQLSII